MDCNDIRKINHLKLKVLFTSCVDDAFRAGSEIRLEAVLWERLCPYLLYLIVPYYETFHDGGFFPWMKNRNEVIVQCPSHDGTVEMAVRRRSTRGKVAVYGEIISVKGRCVWQCAPGQVEEFDRSPRDHRLLQVYGLLFPHLYSISLIEDHRPTIQVQCTDSGNTIFEIS